MLNTIKTIFSTYRYYAMILAACITVSGTFGYMKGSADQRVACATNKTNNLMESVKTHNEIERKVKLMSDDDLDRALSKWVR